MTATVETRLSKLRRFNIIMGFFHLVQGILMLVLSMLIARGIGVRAIISVKVLGPSPADVTR